MLKVIASVCADRITLSTSMQEEPKQIRISLLHRAALREWIKRTGLLFHEPFFSGIRFAHLDLHRAISPNNNLCLRRNHWKPHDCMRDHQASTTTRRNITRSYPLRIALHLCGCESRRALGAPRCTWKKGIESKRCERRGFKLGCMQTRRNSTSSSSREFIWSAASNDAVVETSLRYGVAACKGKVDE